MPKRHAPKGPLVRRDPMPPDHLMGGTCTARAKTTGHRCQRPAIPGGTVCRYHGGAAPQVKFAAMERLRALQQPAVERLASLIQQQEFPTVAFAASRDVLDRTLGKPGESLQVTGADAGPVVFKWQSS